MPPPTWIVPDHIPYGGVVVVYGPPGEGKTFMTMDLALSIASGKQWQGRPTEAGLVVYIAAEGGFGVPQRIRAWCSTHLAAPTSLRIAWLLETAAIDGREEDAMSALIGRIHELVDTPVLIVIDTLARCLVGDENTQQDMGAFVAGVDLLREEFGSTVIVVHHTNVGGIRERGSTSLRGAADTLIKVSRDKDGTITALCDKQKDAEQFATLEMRLQVVPEHASAVMVPAQLASANVILKWLDIGPLSFKEMKARLSEPGGTPMAVSTLKRRLRELKENGKIIKENDVYEKSGTP